MKLMSVLVRTAARKNRVSLYSLYGVSGKQLKEDSQNNMLPMHLDGLDIPDHWDADSAA